MASDTGANLDPILTRPLPKWRINTTDDRKVIVKVVKPRARIGHGGIIHFRIPKNVYFIESPTSFSLGLYMAEES